MEIELEMLKLLEVLDRHRADIYFDRVTLIGRRVHANFRSETSLNAVMRRKV